MKNFAISFAQLAAMIVVLVTVALMTAAMTQ
jgi:hypothetical protein